MLLVDAPAVRSGRCFGFGTREGNLSQVNAPIAVALPLLLDELRDGGIDLITIAADQSGSIELQHLLGGHVTGQGSEGLLLTEGYLASVPPSDAVPGGRR